MERSVSSPSPASTLNSIPNELIATIFSFCSPFSTPLAFVCHQWIDILKYNSGTIWKSVELEIDPIPSPFHMSPTFPVFRSLLKSGMLKNTDSFVVLHSNHHIHKGMREVNEIALPVLTKEIFDELPQQCKFLSKLKIFLPLHKEELTRIFESMTYLKHLSVNLHFFDDVDFVECLRFCNTKIPKLTLKNFYSHVKEYDVFPDRLSEARTNGISTFILPTIAEKFGTDLLELSIEFSKGEENVDRSLSSLALCENLQVLRLDGVDWTDNTTLENLIMSLKTLTTLQLSNNEAANFLVIPEHKFLKYLHLDGMYICERAEIKAPNLTSLYLSQFEICDQVVIHSKKIEFLNITDMSPSFVFYNRSNFGSVKLPLKVLTLGNIQMSVEEFDNLLKNSSETLETINIAGEFPNIEKLNLNLPVLENAVFDSWSAPKKCSVNCPKLQTLCLCFTNIEDVSIKANGLKEFCKKSV